MNRDSQRVNSPSLPRKKPAVTIIFSGKRDGQNGEWHLDFASKAEFELYVYAHGAVLRRDQEERGKRQAKTEPSDDELPGEGPHADTLNNPAPSSSLEIEEEESLFTEPEGSPVPAPIIMRKPRPHPMHREFKKAAALSRKIARKAKTDRTRNAALKRYNFRSQPNQHTKATNSKRSGA